MLADWAVEGSRADFWFYVAAPGDGRAPLQRGAGARAPWLRLRLVVLRACQGAGVAVSFWAVKRKRLPSPPYNPDVRDLVDGKRAGLGQLKADEVEEGFTGWHERGYLPHRDEPGLVQFVTFRLADAFPAELRGEWEALLKIEDDVRRRKELEAYLDLGRGECHLRRPEIASMIEGSLLFGHELQYDLRAWAVMPNHVHVLFLVQAVPMSKLVDALEGFYRKGGEPDSGTQREVLAG
ncbi:MAG: Protein of unknown function Protein of unknown function [Pedosphaera sp.]|nr:Protein of unknown function Protein of unknown function [Pedosphaera sp.]